MNVLKKGLLNLRIWKKINPENLIYKYQTVGISPKDFRTIKTLDLDKIKKRKPKSKSKDQINKCNTKC